MQNHCSVSGPTLAHLLQELFDTKETPKNLPNLRTWRAHYCNPPIFQIHCNPNRSGLVFLGKLDPKYLLRCEGMSIGIMKQIVPPAKNEAYKSPVISAEAFYFLRGWWRWYFQITTCRLKTLLTFPTDWRPRRSPPETTREKSDECICGVGVLGIFFHR